MSTGAGSQDDFSCHVPEYVAEHVRRDDVADGYLHIGLDDEYQPLGGYWIPVGEELAETDQPSKGQLIRYPAEPDRDPKVVGEESVPTWVRK